MSNKGGFEEPKDPTVERTPTLLLLDTSASMNGETPDHSGTPTPKIEQLNEGLEFFKDEIEKVDHAKIRVDVALVSFGDDVSIEQDFTPIENWDPQDLVADGTTPLGEAIEEGVKLVENQKDEYKSNAIAYNRPIIWLLTDGEPTDMSEGGQTWDNVQQILERGTEENHFLFFAMGVGEEADMNTLNNLVSVTGEDAHQIGKGMFREFFKIVSASAQKQSEPGGDDDISPQVPADGS